MIKLLVALGVGLFVLLVGALILRRPEARTPQITGPSGAHVAALPPSAAKRNWLEGVGGDVEGKTFHVGARTVTIGRGVSNFVQITDGNASRVHCQLTPVPQGLHLKDMRSRNGTLVNGQRVTETLLRDGDELAIGAARFRYSQLGRFDVDYALLAPKVAAEQGATQALNVDAVNIALLARETLDATGGDVDEAARRLGIHPDVLRRMVGLG